MLSSDKNIENIVQLIEALKEYFELKKSYLKYDVVDKVVRLTAALALTVIILLLTIGMLFYASFALVYWMAPTLGLAGAFGVVSLAFLGLLIATLIFRKSWIERPLVRLMVSILLEK